MEFEFDSQAESEFQFASAQGRVPGGSKICARAQVRFNFVFVEEMQQRLVHLLVLTCPEHDEIDAKSGLEPWLGLRDRVPSIQTRPPTATNAAFLGLTVPASWTPIWLPRKGGW